MIEFRPCAIVPTYNNPITIRPVVEAIREHVPDVIVVDDGSAEAGRSACDQLARAGAAVVVRRERNGGKGAAVKTGFEAAREAGYTHALQVDADGQHDISRAGAFLAAAKVKPNAAVLAYPEYDESAPRGRLIARRITTFWVNLETGRGTIRDAMVGFRVYPLAAVQGLKVRGDRMDFDVEVAVRLAWAGVEIVNLPVKVRYLDESEGGVSNFHAFSDNVRLSWMHSRLCTWKVFSFVMGPVLRRLPSADV